MPDERRVNLREIADKTGISRMAVSLALRGKPGVSDATRKKVMKAAKEMGYEPDPEVAKLMSHIRKSTPSNSKACLAILTSGVTPDDWKRSTTERKYVEGAHERAKKYGYRLEEFWLNEPGMSMKRLGSIIWNRGIEGVVIAPLQGPLSESRGRSIELDYSLFAVVEISETVDWPSLDRSIHDQYTSMLKCIEELMKLNYRKIGMVLEDALDRRVNGRWTAAFLQSRNRDASRLVPPLILKNADQVKFNKWLDRYGPDAVISVDQFGLNLLRARGITIPQEIGYASLDLDGVSKNDAGISGIDQNSWYVGAAAVDMVVSAIHRGHRGIPRHPMRTDIEGAWREGSSTRKQ